MRNKTLADIAEICGHRAAIELTRTFGGRRMTVPRDVDESHPLALTIGMTAARRLCKAKHGKELSIPSEINAILDLRNDAICRDFDSGDSIRAMSIKYGISRKWVRHILLRKDRAAELNRRAKAYQKS